MKRTALALFIALAVLPFSVTAHKAWLQPSQTVIAGTDSWITVDAAVSNDLFYFNHVPLRLDNLIISAPDGTKDTAQNAATGKLRSVFDVQLKQQGTYRLAIVNSGLIANWQEDGKPKRWRGTAAAFASEVPKDAKELSVSQSVTRNETYVTNGSPTRAALATSGEGIELVPVTHPNDLFAGDEARFKLQIDGIPAVGLEIEITRGGTRYRNAQDEIKVKTNANGEFAITWPEAGMYWLETVAEDKKTSFAQATQRRLGYVVTMEVLPQ